MAADVERFYRELITDLRKCIEEGHAYGEEPTCQRCGHYGPGDREHVLRLERDQFRSERDEARAALEKYRGTGC